MGTIATEVFFQTEPSRGIRSKQGVDRKRNVIYGPSVATRGPVPSHGVEFDAKSLSMLSVLGNRATGGIKSRFAHPSMLRDGLGSFLGRWFNFRVEGDRLRADLHLSSTASTSPQGDLAAYIMGLAIDDPDAFGVSVVLPMADVERAAIRGEPIRPTEFRAADFVDSPAANSGLFSTPNRKAKTMTISEQSYRAEFRQAGGQGALGVTEERYVASCMTTDAGGVVGGPGGDAQLVRTVLADKHFDELVVAPEGVDDYAGCIYDASTFCDPVVPANSEFVLR